ncbi:hypothetical protein AB0M12_31925 [Nocardia vinacea]|uniref:hypothetical protein n=1 Tax=Nocardia vinacea TaxID=96468 RepID=UPI00344AE9B4
MPVTVAEIGHACGHNIIAASAVGAGLGLAEVADALTADKQVFDQNVLGSVGWAKFVENMPIGGDISGSAGVVLDSFGAADVAYRGRRRLHLR